MADKTNMFCPVCGSKPHNPEPPGVVCDKCGFEFAFIKYIADSKSKTIWENKIVEARDQLRIEKMTRYSQGDYFVLAGDSVAYISYAEKKLFFFDGDGAVEEKENVIQYSRSERNSAILFENGQLKAFGDNSYGQCNVQSLSDVSSVLCAPNCIYAVGKDGRVVIVGAVVDPEIKTWKDISTMTCGSFHVLGLTKSNKVRIAGEMIEQSVVDKVTSWENVKSICAATDCSIALFQDGTVSFAGRQNDPRREVESWKGIVSVKADSSYAVGLTKEGDIRLAGACKTYLDMGRSSAALWKNVLAVTCSRSGIAAILNNGALLIVGNFSGDIETVVKNWTEKVEI